MFLIIKFDRIKLALLALLLLIAVVLSATAILRWKTGKSRSVFSESGNPILVIDAGHGGTDGGAVSDAGTTESELNLSISKKMYALSHLLGMDVVMTRESEELNYPPEADTIRKKKVYDQKQRIAAINSISNAVLISVHQNMFPSSQPRGPQVLYAATEMSRNLAELTQENLRLLLPSNTRTATQISDSIYLMKNIHCPAILVECGFLSNPEDEYLLKNENYQRKISLLLICSYLQFLNAGPITTA